MKRREFLVGGASVGLSSKGLAAGGEPNFDPAVVEAALAKIDARMVTLGALDFPHRAAGSPAEAELQAWQTRVGRAAARTLYFTGAFMELEEHQRLHPGVQVRLRRLAPEMDVAVDGMATLLESQSPDEHRALRDTLRTNPSLADRIGEDLHRVAKEDGFGFLRRVDLRLAVKDLVARMSAQNPALVLDPPVQKVRKIQAHPRTDAEQERILVTRVGEKAFWEFQQRSLQAVAQWDQIYAARPALYLGALEETYPAPPPKSTPQERKDHTIRDGLIVMGVGLGTMALGGLFYLFSAGGSVSWATGTAVVLGVTVGPMILLAGLIVLIVGLAMSGNPEPDDKKAQETKSQDAQ